jgi:hypothetical protein
MNHSFDISDAEKYGVIEAILLGNLRHWVLKNKANGKHFYDGCWWTYNSVKAFAELFPYLTKDKVRRALESLRDAGAIKIGNYNQSPYDKTSWYSVNSIGENSLVDLANLPNGSGNPANSDTNINTDIKPNTRGAALTRPPEVDGQVWDDWLTLRKAKKAPVTKTTLSEAEKQAALAGLTLEDFLRAWCRRGSQGFEASWLRPDEKQMSYRERDAQAAADRVALVAPSIAAKPYIDAATQILSMKPRAIGHG